MNKSLANWGLLCAAQYLHFCAMHAVTIAEHPDILPEIGNSVLRLTDLAVLEQDLL